MNQRTFILRTLVMGALLISLADKQAVAANMRSFIEAVRRNAPVVYVGLVRKVQNIPSNDSKGYMKARAEISILAVTRGSANSRSETTINYLAYDDQNPPPCGPPHYYLHPGTIIIVFAKSFESEPLYLLQGNRKELLKQVEAIRDHLSHMSGDQLRVNEITKKDREVQLALYDKLCKDLRATP